MHKSAVGDETKPGPRTRQLDGQIALLGVVALVLLGPLREVFAAYPLVLFASTLSLFLVPGALVAHWFTPGRFYGAALVPVSFVISTGIFGLLGVPLLMVHLSLNAYIAMSGAVTGAFLMLAVFRVARDRRVAGRERKETDEDGGRIGNLAGASSRWLWAPFLVFSSTLAFISRLRVPGVYEDLWIYLAYVREFLGKDRLGLYEPYFGNETGLSRVMINGWLLEQAALSRISGIDPVELVLRYLTPALIIASLLAFYVLARTLFRSEAAALLAGCGCALFFLVNLNQTFYSFGGEFISRIAEDKFVARFLFLPVALALAFAYLEGGRARYLVGFSFVCWSVMAVHPVGLAIAGLGVGGFGLVEVVLHWRRREVWKRVAGLGVGLLSVVLIPAVLVFMTTGESLTAVLSDADINSSDPDLLANMVFVRARWKHVYELGGGYYIMHPSLVLDPVILGALLLGVPFLVRRLRSSSSARLLLGTLLLSFFVCYVPPVATFVGNNVVLPGQLWRLAWPIPLAALLTAGWMAWEAIRRAEAHLGRFGAAGRGAALVTPLALVVAIAVVVAPSALAGAEAVYRKDKEIAKRPACFDPIFTWMRDNITQPSVVLAPDAENTCIPAYSASANVVSLRGAAVLDRLSALERRAPGQIEVPQRALDVRRFYRDSSPEEKAQILRRYDVDYVMLRADSRLRGYLEDRPAFTVVDTPSEQHILYAVDLRKLPHTG